jgi:hypothetical protein
MIEILTALLLGFSPQSNIFFNTVQEYLTTLRVPDMLNPQVDTLFNKSISNPLVDQNTNSSGGNIVDDTSAPIKNIY